ncbi:MAG: 1-deoxy-D-xylulose-5-phosphate synthase [Planctomycetota bacterium]|nr:1-deoxy-D-xylulose-5-phosphate synthase [Planctomycetota bacterium]
MNIPLLSEIRSPQDIQDLNDQEMKELCQDIRAALIEKVFQSGGHLGSNLGVVELVAQLHRSFDFSKDRLVFDVGHQCYTHKILTGRFNRFDTLRKTNGLSGFCNRKESPYDVLTAGHAGTSISFAAGLAEGHKGLGGKEGEDPWSVALIGDSAFSSGVAFEGLTQAAEKQVRMVVVLNDNEWSISRSVGTLARYLSRIRSSRTLNAVYDRVQSLAHRLPAIGERMDEVGEVIRHVLVPGHVFEELGVNYIGPLDGHDLEQVESALTRAKRLGGVTLCHFLTEKGHGYEPAGTDPERAHGVSPRKVPSPVNQAARAASPKRQAFTAVFSQALCRLGGADTRIHAITAGMPSGAGLSQFASDYPSRFHDTGITEQHAVAFAGGLATTGKKPVVAIYSTFLQRGYDQVFQEVALQQEDVVFCLDRAGLVGQDGPTHQGLYDMAYLRGFPGFQLASPRDAVDLERMLAAALSQKGPWGLRWPRGTAVECLGLAAELRPELTPGTAERLREGASGAVFALGAMVEHAMEVADRLSKEHQIELEVWDARFCSPMDQGALAGIARRQPWLATVEEHALAGGFGSAVCETLADLGAQIPVSRHGVPHRWIEHMSSREEQLELCGLSTDVLFSEWKNLASRSSPVSLSKE